MIMWKFDFESCHVKFFQGFDNNLKDLETIFHWYTVDENRNERITEAFDSAIVDKTAKKGGLVKLNHIQLFQFLKTFMTLTYFKPF